MARSCLICWGHLAFVVEFDVALFGCVVFRLIIPFVYGGIYGCVDVGVCVFFVYENPCEPLQFCVFDVGVDRCLTIVARTLAVIL